jgi:HAD superfamily hydrolase (TIGR01490 family)
MRELKVLHDDFMETVILPMIGEKANALVKFHKQQNHTLLVITATNSFITRPIVEDFGINNPLATEPKIKNGRYLNVIDGIPCFRSGKVTRLNDWLKHKGFNLKGSFFYTDSHNDLPLMEIVDNAVAVDPDEKLA